MEYSHTGSSLKAIQLFLHAILYNFRGKEELKSRSSVKRTSLTYVNQINQKKTVSLLFSLATI